MNLASPDQRASHIECPAIHYFYYVIANTLQARGEVLKVNEGNIFILAKATNQSSNHTQSLGTILLLRLSRQANQTRGGIT